MTTEEAFFGLPPEWRAHLRSCEVTRVRRGMSAAALFHVRGAGSPELYLKIGRDDEAGELRGEIARLRWLAERGLRVPALRCSFDGRTMVAAMMEALPGEHPASCGRPTGTVVEILARGLRAWHAHPVAGCPFDEGIEARLTRARALIGQGAIAPEHFADRNAGCTPQQIYDRLLAARPQKQDLVLVHGDATLDNILIDTAGNAGFLDCGHSGRGERMVDLALLATEVGQSFGAGWVTPFLNAYGAAHWDAGSVAFFDDLYELF